MTQQEIFHKLSSLPNGPSKKFQLIKLFGAALKAKHEFDPRMFGCERLQQEIRKLIEESV